MLVLQGNATRSMLLFDKHERNLPADDRAALGSRRARAHGPTKEVPCPV